jgi:hypothetical protein
MGDDLGLIAPKRRKAERVGKDGAGVWHHGLRIALRLDDWRDVRCIRAACKPPIGATIHHRLEISGNLWDQALCFASSPGQTANPRPTLAWCEIT